MNKKAIALLFLANAVSGVAQGISMLAIPWYFAQQDALYEFGIVYIITNLISLFWVPISGTLIDRFDRKKVFLGITFVGGSIVGLVTCLGYYFDGLPLMLVGAVFLFTFLNYNIHFPNVLAFVQEITERKNYSKMTSLLEIIGQMTTVTAGAVGTLLLEGTNDGAINLLGLRLDIGMDIPAWRIEEIFLIDTLTYFVSFLIISLIVYTPLKERISEKGSVITRLKIGWNYLKTDKPIFIYGVLSYIVFVAMLLEAFYLGVSYVNNHLQASGDTYANSKVAYALGAMLTGISLKYLFTRYSLPLITILLTIGTAIIFFIQYASQSVALFFMMLFLLGITNAGTRIARVTYLFRNIPNQYFGRSSSIFFIGNIIIRILLLLVFALPFFQVANNIIFAYLITSLVLFLAGILLIVFYKSFDLSKTK